MSSISTKLSAQDVARRAERAFGPTPPQAVVSCPNQIVLKLKFENGMDRKDFERKIARLRFSINKGSVYSKIPHGVSKNRSRAETRKYRRRLEKRINSFYKNNKAAREKALEKLEKSDVDHILDLQLGGENKQRNLKALHSETNQELGSQVSQQLPRNKRVRITGIEVIE